jgi:hypothetical protein
VDARKQSFDAKAAVALLRTGKRILAAKGKKIVELDPQTAADAEIAAAALGPSGNLRAPAIRAAGSYLVGFSEETFSRMLRER